MRVEHYLRLYTTLLKLRATGPLSQDTEEDMCIALYDLRERMTPAENEELSKRLLELRAKALTHAN